MTLDLKRVAPELLTLPKGVWLVGGAVRDLLLEREPKDFDVACDGARSAAEQFSREQRGRFVDLGRDRFATFRVVLEEREFDFTDLQGSLEEDLGRRDCTINAMAIECAEPAHIVDPFDGRGDLSRRLLRMVRESNFVDDPLRVLKLVRMQTTIGFELDGATMEAMHRSAPSLERIAAERIAAELDRIFCSERVSVGVETIAELGLDEFLFGRAITPADLPALSALPLVEPIVARAIVVRGLPQDTIISLGERARWGSDVLRNLLRLLDLAERFERLSEEERLLSVHRAGEVVASRTILFLRAVGRDHVAKEIEAIIRKQSAIFTMEPLFDGREISAALGIEPGRKVGELKERLLVAQLRGEITTRDAALEFLRRSAGN